MTESISQLTSNEAVCRTAPATPGLLIIYHFTTCEAYRNEPLPNWHEINGTDTDKILTVGLAIERRVE